MSLAALLVRRSSSSDGSGDTMMGAIPVALAWGC